MAQNFWTAIFAFTAALVLTFLITVVTKRTKTDEQLKGLVYSLTPKTLDDSKHWYQKPGFMAIIVGAMALALSLLFW
jgi:SSS family solute:Na+ symporter